MTAARIAIVGMACRYPDANSPAELWQNVLAGRRAFRRIPAERLGTAYRGEPDDPDRTYVDRAAVLRDWEFDRSGFGVPGPLFRATDLTHWLALETAAAALADAGRPGGEGLDRDATGVVLGNSLTGEFSRAATLRLRWPFLADAAATALHAGGVADPQVAEVLGHLERLVKEPFEVPGDESLAGALANTIAGRICNHFDLHGTGYTVDGACSSSLLAVMTACNALAAGECDFMLAGGVDLSLDPFELVGFARLGALAADEMRVYDRAPTGFLPGEGCGVVALMRAEDAERAHLRSYGHLVGWASSSDGSGGLTRPERSGQALALRRAYRMAELDPAAVGLVEGHGTGTAVGDRVELETLNSVRGAGAPAAALGTIKANIGHTKAAAGVAGLIKATLASHHRVLPPTTGCERPHELFADAPLRVLPEAEVWADRTPRAAVSSMGFGGINVHLVVEGRTSAAAPRRLPPAMARWARRTGRHEIVVAEANDVAALRGRLERLAGLAERLGEAEVRDVAATAWGERSGTARFRAALVARTPDELAAAAAEAAAATADWTGGVRADARRGFALGAEPARVGLLLPGQAAPVRTELAAWARDLDVPDLPTELVGRDAEVDTLVAQPAVLRQSLAGMAWLHRIGVEAVAATGHSLGEIAALHWAGACDAAEALELGRVRGRIMAEHGRAGTAMIAVGAAPELVDELIAGTSAVVAGYNAPERVIVSGTLADVEVVLGRARDAAVPASHLPVSHAFHSPAMIQARQPLREALATTGLGALERPVLSTITGEQLPPAEDLRELLVEQLTAPVRFTEALAALAKQCDVLVEAGPGAILAGLASANSCPVPVVAMDCAGDPRSHAFATAVLAACAEADLDPWFADRPSRPLAIDAEPRFLANPVELRSGWSRAPELPREGLGSAPAPVEVDAADPLVALTRHLSTTLELPEASIAPSSSLLGDLHLNSLQVVQAVNAVAKALGKQVPAAPLTLSDADVADVAHVLRELPAQDAAVAAPPDSVAGVRGWVRTFETAWEPFAAVRGDEVAWEVLAPDGHWLHQIAASDGEPRGLAIALLAEHGPDHVADLLARLGRAAPAELLVVHAGHPAAAGLARSAAVELERCRVVVVEVPEQDHRFDPADVADPAGDRYLDVALTADGALHRRVARARTPGEGAEIPLGRGEVCLVTGGVHGISAYAAAALAERTGCSLVFLGRTGADDPAVRTAVRELSGRADVHYLACDVGDESAVHRVVARVREIGEVRGLLHGAGVNEPALLGGITRDSFARTLRPKVRGLRVLLDAVGADLRLVLGFGSIIGRQGLSGQAEYCVANDWMRVELERWAHHGCRTHVLEWSLWSGIGMGVRLDVVDSLRRRGVEPIGPRDGVDAMLDVLADPEAPVSVLVTSRFPTTPTLSITGGPPRWLRFAEEPRVLVPGVEAVVEAELSLGSDPYLDDHRIEGSPVLPAVVGMEAMAQAAATAGAAHERWALTDLEFRTPVVVEQSRSRRLRLAALVDGGAAEVALRDDTDDFGTDRFTGRVVAAAAPPGPRDEAEVAVSADDAPTSHYGSTLFHRGRFRRVLRYDQLSAFRVRAWIRADPRARWFSDFHSGDLLLGDPGAHDAALHALLACVPHRRALPVGADRVDVWCRPDGLLRVLAEEVAHGPDDYVFDVDLVGADGTPVARWSGLRLRAVGPLELPDGPAADLVGPWLSRRMIECGLPAVELMTAPGTRRAGTAAALAARATGDEVWHDPAGALRTERCHLSASYRGDEVLLAMAPVPVGADWTAVPAGGCADVLDGPDRRTAGQLADALGGPPEAAGARVWSAREAVTKLGITAARPLRVDEVAADGLAVLSARDVRIATAAHGGVPAVTAIAVPVEG
ncbi:SDR family NAD(P)-dependent oxidoreductase [Saccharopolyspora cebuensis]|uniref:SDR family NAD(P)-dependent oxidoreductase n=1 Tax=Saccharopolyspora cebuensis TaxID=418759 RepID=UPI0031E793DF